MKKHVSFFIIINILCLNLLQAQTTDIPDANFEQALIDLGIDTDGLNGQVLTADINTLTDLYIIDKDIADLRGIQDFISLTSLNCAYNNLTSLDVSNNTDLESLDFSSNQIANVNLSANLSLKSLICSYNQLNNLNISVNDSLTTVDCSNNQLSSIDVSSHIFLRKLTCSSNQITGINIIANDSLTFLNCSGNQLNSLDVSNNTFLTSLFCASNQLSNIDLTANDSLTFLDCSSNQLTNLDLSSNFFLTNLTCSSNLLGSLNLNQNDSLTFLSCANNQLNNIDLSNNITLTNLIGASNQLTNIDLSFNVDLQGLDLSSNLLSDLDLSSNTSLTSLNCSDNQLKSLNVQNSNNAIITIFNATTNPNLRCIEVDDPISANSNDDWKKDDIATYNVNCISYTYVPDDNFEVALSAYDDIADDDYVPTENIETLTSLDINSQSISDLTGIEDFIGLETLNCSLNSLINLNMSAQVNLITLNCSSNNLEALVLKNKLNGIFINLDATVNPLLTCIQVDDVTAANGEADWLKDVTASYNLNCRTYVPDDNFEQALIDLGYDKGGLDDYVVTDSINTVTVLDISNQNIFDLTGIEDFIALDSLNCSKNKLTDLDISAIPDLEKLICNGNYLSTLDVSSNTSLTKLICGDNNLNSLNVNSNLALQQLNCDANQLTGIDISMNTGLQIFNCNSNYITNTGLDISNNINLTQLFCSNNKLTSIDVTTNTLLLELDCSNNQIAQLDLDNNTDLVRLDCSINKLSNLNVTLNTELLNINCNSNLITDLNFTPNSFLRYLSCDNNALTGINVSSNDSIRELSASNNKLPQIIVDNIHFLRSFNVSDNKLNSLILTSNDSLRIISCVNNNLPSLNVNNNLFLNTLNCNNNQLVSLIITNNDSIFELSCSNNNLENLNLSNNFILRNLYVDGNQLTDLGVSVNDSLRKVSCAGNQLSSLDFSNNAYLTSVTSSSNQLTSFNVQNGNNGILETFYSRNNPDLTCIEIDNELNIGESWEKDESATFAENCHYSETYIPDDNFEAALSVIIGESSNNNDNYIPTVDIEALTSLDVSNEGIVNLTGLQGFVTLISLNIEGNLIDSLDISQNTSIINLNCANNQLDSLGFSGNANLEILDFSSNLLTEIDVSYLTGLMDFSCSNNDLTDLDLSNNGNLTSVNIASNQLTTLHVNNGNNAILSSFNATNNPDLSCIEVDDPAQANSGSGVYSSWQVDATASYSENCHYNETYVPDDAFEQALKELGYDDSGTDPLDDYVPTDKINTRTYLSIRNKGISDLTGIEDFVDLVTLNSENNALISLDFSNNLALENLLCSGNQLSNLNVSSNTILRKLEIADNLFTSIDLSNNDSLRTLDCSLNQLTSLNILNNTYLTSVNCSSNQLISVDANNSYNDILLNFDLRDNPNLTCILVDDITASEGYAGWYKDPTAFYKLECNDDDNDGVADSEDQCPNTPFGDFVDLFGCSVFILSADNYSIYSKSETCRSGNNGLINISTVEILNYKATLIGNEDTISHSFTDHLEIRNLRAGTYDLCLEVDEEPDYIQCYNMVITEPDDLDVQLKSNLPDKSVSLKMSGGTNYTIDLNGLVFNTAETDITLPLKNGKNTLSVKTAVDCQGVFKETIFIAEETVVFPNPFGDYLNLYIGKEYAENTNVNIFSWSGQLIWSKQYNNQKEPVEITTSDLKPGVYYLLLKSENYQSTIKIIKE